MQDKESSLSTDKFATQTIGMNNSTDSFGLHDSSIQQVPHAFRAVFFGTISVVALISLIGNILEIITYLKTQNLRNSTNYYITSMAVSDVLLVVSGWAQYATSRLSVFDPSLSSFVCKLGLYIQRVSYSISITSLVLITVDRFVAIVFPMRVSMITGRVRAVLILLTWVIPMGIFSPYIQNTRKAEEDERQYICADDMSRLAGTINLTTFFVLFYLAPLIIITILNFRIMKSLRRTNPVIQGNSQNNTTRRKRNQRIMKILILINISFFVRWTPLYAMGFSLSYFLKHFKVHVLEILHLVCVYFLPLLSTAFNPVILFTFSTNYRQALKDCLRLVVAKCCSCLKFQQAAREENVELPELHLQ